MSAKMSARRWAIAALREKQDGRIPDGYDLPGRIYADGELTADNPMKVRR